MARLDRAIHLSFVAVKSKSMDGPVKPGHDE
jgi:hypothetical protein